MTTPRAYAFTHAITLAEADGKLWIQILAAGEWKHPEYGKLTIGPDDLREMVKNFDAGARRFVYADFDHGIARADGSGNAINAGEVVKLEVRNKDAELWALFEPTDRARERIKAKEYRYTSADFATAYRDKVTGKSWGKVLRGFALTNTPFIEGMHPLTLGDASAAILFADFTTTDPSGDAGRERLMPKLAETLGLRADATDEQIETKVKQLNEGLTKAAGEIEDVREALHLSEKDDLVKEAKKLAEAHSDLTKKDREREADKLLDTAVREGRLTPAAKPDWRTRLLHDNDAVATSTRELLEKLPKSVPVSERKASEGKPIAPSDYEARFDEKVTALRKEDPKLSYKDALILAEQALEQKGGAGTEE